MSSRSGLPRNMRYKDLPRGKIFQFTPQPGTRYAAMKADNGAYLLHNGEQVTIHANKDCTEIPILRGDSYRLGVVGDSSLLVIFSQANDTQVFVHDFLVIGHAMHPKTTVKPIVGKVERQEQAELVNIILTKLEANAQKTENLLKVLRDGLFEDFGKIKLT